MLEVLKSYQQLLSNANYGSNHRKEAFCFVCFLFQGWEGIPVIITHLHIFFNTKELACESSFHQNLFFSYCSGPQLSSYVDWQKGGKGDGSMQAAVECVCIHRTICASRTCLLHKWSCMRAGARLPLLQPGSGWAMAWCWAAAHGLGTPPYCMDRVTRQSCLVGGRHLG